MQQVGGSIGTALLSTVAAHATASYITDHPGRSGMLDGAVHGYTTAFVVAAGIFVLGAAMIFLLIKPHVVPGSSAEPTGAKAAAPGIPTHSTGPQPHPVTTD